MQYDSKPLCFYNWLKGGILYVKDIFDETGEMYDITYFSNKLVEKNNIICEYVMLKRAVKHFRQKFDCSYAKYVNIKNDVHVLFKNHVTKSIKSTKSNFYYSIFIDNKFQKSVQENIQH